VHEQQAEKVSRGKGFFAALDQSGGSTPKALREYGISDDAYGNDEQMFDLVHAMRSRIITSSAFTGDRIIGAILFEQTMKREIDGVATPDYLWDRKGIVPFLKVDKGLADTANGAQVMKDIGDLADQVADAKSRNVFGTKMRSVIKLANPAGVDAVLDQQFAYADVISHGGLVPILEPEVDITSPEKQAAEDLLVVGIFERLSAIDPGRPIMLKLSLPTVDNRYAELITDPRVMRVVALSGGYDRTEACQILARNPGLIASFSRALLEGLSAGQTDEEFNSTLSEATEAIYAASSPSSPS
jgi:fructose-bisphosphate aldolase class I